MPLTKELEQTLKKLRSQKKTLQEIANATELSRITVSRYLKELGLQRKPINLNPKEVVELYKTYTINEIAKQFNVSHKVISRILKDQNINYSKEENIKKHFKRVHQEQWPAIQQDLNQGLSKIAIAKKYKMRIQHVAELIHQNNYQKEFQDSLEPLTQAFQDAEALQGKQKTTRLKYLKAIQTYIQTHQEWPSKSNLAQELGLAPITVSLYINHYQLNRLVKPTSTSNRVKSIIALLKELNIPYELNNRQVLHNKQEINIWIPTYNLGIEINPVSTHTIDDPKWGFTSKTYHQNKALQAKQQNIGLIHLYDEDFENSRKWNVLKEQLFCLTQTKQKIGARTCIIKEITKQTAQTFLNQYHFQGADQSAAVRLGIYHHDQLLGVFTCGKSRFTHHDWELYRYCVNPHYIVHGVFNKLLQHFIAHYTTPGQTLITYMDLNKRLTASNIYERSQFEVDGITEPNYSWIQRNTFECLTRYQTTKKHLITQGYDPSQTEREIMRKRGFYRVFDAGSLRYTKKL
jgi:predicted transcriptional regulator